MIFVETSPTPALRWKRVPANAGGRLWAPEESVHLLDFHRNLPMTAAVVLLSYLTGHDFVGDLLIILDLAGEVLSSVIPGLVVLL
jgi:hypothetical protein